MDYVYTGSSKTINAFNLITDILGSIRKTWYSWGHLLDDSFAIIISINMQMLILILVGNQIYFKWVSKNIFKSLKSDWKLCLKLFRIYGILF